MKLSVIIPVLNEMDRINPLIRQLRGLTTGRDTEIIVIDGNEGGSTVRNIADNGIITALSPPGRGVQMNRGASLATGDVLLFLHADTILPEGAITGIEKAMAGTVFVGGAFDMELDNPGFLFKLTGCLASLKHRVTKIPYGDQAIFIRAAYFRGIGGYREIPIMEDVEIMKRIKKQGGRIAFLPMKVTTSARKWIEDGFMYTIARNWALQILYLLRVPPERLVRYYYRKA